MYRFNLSFRGEIKAGYERERVQPKFARLLAIEDPDYLRRCFSGAPLVLRSDLDRKQAADLYHKLDQIGAVAELERYEAADEPATQVSEPAVKQAAGEGRAWAVSRSQQRRTPRGKHKKKPAKEARPRPAPAAKPAPPRGARIKQWRASTARQLADLAARARPAPRKRRRATPARTAAPPAAPNLYQIQPFRHSADLRERPRRATRSMRRALLVAATALLALGVASALLPGMSPPTPPKGASHMATLHDGGLLLVLPDRLLLHDRAGVGSAGVTLDALGLEDVTSILPAHDSQHYFVRARAAADPDAPPAIWRCNLQPTTCTVFLEVQPLPDAISIHPYSGIQLHAYAGRQALQKISADGELVAAASHPLADPPVLRLRDGLLYTNSREAPAVSVLRYEDDALGSQLDELILLAPAALEAGQERVTNFLHAADNWWAVMRGEDSSNLGLYRFGSQWGFEGSVALPANFDPQQLLDWNGKLLALDSTRPEILRFNADGAAEVPLSSDLLEGYLAGRAGEIRLFEFLAGGLRTGLALLLAGALLIAYLQDLRRRAFSGNRLQGAAPLAATPEITWLSPSPYRAQRLQRINRLYLALVCVLLVGAVLLRIEVHQLGALLLFLAGPAGALALLQRSPTGFLGVQGNTLVLVDHRNRYHQGQTSRILYRSWFLMIDDILVYAGPRWFPAFEPRALQESVAPLAATGVRVDRKAVLARLVESRHPLAVGGGLILTGAALAALSLSVA